MARKMSSYEAIAILDGFADGEVTAEDILAACRWIRDHGPRGVLAGSGTTRAIQIADYADRHGNDDAIDLLMAGA